MIRHGLHNDRLGDAVSDFGAVLLTECPAAALRVLDAVPALFGPEDDLWRFTRAIRFENGVPALLAMAVVMSLRGVTPKRLRLTNRIIGIVDRAGRMCGRRNAARRWITADGLLDSWRDPLHPGRNRLVRRILRRRGLLRTRRERAVVHRLRLADLLETLRRTEGVRVEELALIFPTG